LRHFFEKYSGRFLFIIALLAFTALLLQYGFYLSIEIHNLISYSYVIIFGLFIYYQFGRIYYSERRIEYIKSRWFDFLLLVLILIQTVIFLIIPSAFVRVAGYFNVTDLNVFYIIVLQIYIVVSLSIKATRFGNIVAEFKIQPAKLFLISFFLLIIFGTGMLMLPRATITGNISFVDALFTSTSAVCVTGLIVVDTATYFTQFGQIIILCLIQIGGLGVMTITTFFAIFFAGGLGIKERVLIGDMIDEEKIGQISKTLIQIILLTFVIEAIGAVLIFRGFENSTLNLNERIYHSIFHSVSAFCNAGFSTFSENLYSIHTRFNYTILGTISILIVCGGFGFTAIMNVLETAASKFIKSRLRRRHLTIQTKIVLLSSAILIFGGMIAFFLLEYNNTLKDFTLDQKILASLLQSVTTRTAGFNTLPIDKILIPTSLIFIMWMLIGASPGGTGGGLKTTTVFISIVAFFEFVSGKKKVEIFHRSIPDAIIHRVFTKIVFSFVFLFTTLIILSYIENHSLIDLIFEQVSAFGTVGLSRGITGELTDTGKLIITLIMYIGRVGPLTFILALTRKVKTENYDYPSENISTI
jgi:potassium uptake TrkH family protein